MMTPTSAKAGLIKVYSTARSFRKIQGMIAAKWKTMSAQVGQPICSGLKLLSEAPIFLA